MTEVLTRNGVKLWQGISGTAVTIAVAAVGWNYAQIHNLDLAVVHLNDMVATPSAAFMELQKADFVIRDRMAVIQARQDEVLRRLDRIEASLNRSGRNGSTNWQGRAE